MLKKSFLSLVLVVAAVCCAKADFGVSFGGSILSGKNNFDSIKIQPPGGGSYSLGSNAVFSSYEGWQIAVFYDIPSVFGLGDKHSIGAKLGYSDYGTCASKHTELKVGNPYTLAELYDVDADIYSLPLTIYYKYDLARKWKVWAGAGVSLITNEWNIKTEKGSKTKPEDKLSPHFDAGIEWQFSKLFGLEFNLGYLFNAKFRSGLYFDGEEIYNDLSGLVLNLAFKIHIF